MIIKYEKLDSKEEIVDGKTELVSSFTSVEKEVDADFIHYCGHDKNPPEPCRRVRIK